MDIPFNWITPSGLIIKHVYKKFDKVKVKSNLISKAKPVTIALPTLKPDVRKTKQGLIANLIHSLDASNIHLLLNYYVNILQHKIFHFTLCMIVLHPYRMKYLKLKN
jgi:DNA-directed RNA polymerase